jgi:hypothetical protein
MHKSNTDLYHHHDTSARLEAELEFSEVGCISRPRDKSLGINKRPSGKRTVQPLELLSATPQVTPNLSPTGRIASSWIHVRPLQRGSSHWGMIDGNLKWGRGGA